MFTQEEISKINKSVSKQEFDTSVYIYPEGDEVGKSVTYTFEIVGIKTDDFSW
jgi:hypothetical protein